MTETVTAHVRGIETVAGGSTFTLMAGGERVFVMSRSIVILRALVPALLGGVEVTLDVDYDGPAQKVIRRVHAFGPGSRPGHLSGEYSVGRIATQREKEADRLEAFLVSVRDSTEKFCNIYDEHLQHVVVSVFQAYHLDPGGVRIRAELDGPRLISVGVGDPAR